MLIVPNFVTSKRKKLCFFLLLYLVIISVTPAQDFYGLLNNAFDQPGLTRLGLTDLQESQIKLSSGYVYEDYFRESTSGKGSQTLDGNISSIALLAINARRDIKYGIFFQGRNLSVSYSSLNADRYINTDYLNEGRDLELHMVIGNEKMLWGMGIDQQSKTLSAPVLINKYPESEDSQMNRYFFDWLEPSFGNELIARSKFNWRGITTYTSLPLGSHLILNLNYRISDKPFAPCVDYQNTSNIQDLQGDRRMIFDGASVNQVLEIDLESPDWSLKPTVTIQKTDADLTIVNPLPEGVIDDFPELGELDISHRGGSFALEGQYKNLAIEAGIGYSRWEANTELTTPVLGRYWFVPIAHAAQLQISGESISQRLNLSKELFNQDIRVDLKAGYQHAYFDFQVIGEADLEFNLRSVPIDDPFQLHLHVISIGVPISYTFNSITLHYEFTQMIPWYERVDSSPLKLQGERPSDRKVRGGGQHMIVLSYTWSELKTTP